MSCSGEMHFKCRRRVKVRMLGGDAVETLITRTCQTKQTSEWRLLPGIFLRLWQVYTHGVSAGRCERADSWRQPEGWWPPLMTDGASRQKPLKMRRTCRASPNNLTHGMLQSTSPKSYRAYPFQEEFSKYTNIMQDGGGTSGQRGRI